MQENQQEQTSDDVAAAALASVSANHQTSDDVGQALVSLQHVIERNVSELERLKAELRVERDSLKNVFENDQDLAQAEEQAAAVTQVVKEKKSRVQASPQVTQLKAKISELSDQKKEIEESLNNHLVNLFQLTGTKTLDMSDGSQREFRLRASLLQNRHSEE